MVRLLVGCILSFYVASASAADLSCTAQATEKKLAGAAKTSFMNKCERDARTSCEAAAGEKAPCPQDTKNQRDGEHHQDVHQNEKGYPFSYLREFHILSVSRLLNRAADSINQPA